MPNFPSGASPGAGREGLIGQAIELFAAAWGYLRARFELAGLEGKEAGIQWLKALALLFCGLVVLVFGYFFFVLAAIFAIAFAIGGKTAWIWVTLGAALLHAGGAAALLLKVRGLVTAPVFPITLDEFRKDQAWLEREDRKAELIAELGIARGRLDRGSAKLRKAIDIPTRVRQNFSRNLFAWLGGATLFGILLAKVPARKKKVYVDPQGKRVRAGGDAAKAGFLVAGLKVAFDLARPFLLKLAAEKLRPMAEQYFTRYQQPDTE